MERGMCACGGSSEARIAFVYRRGSDHTSIGKGWGEGKGRGEGKTYTGSGRAEVALEAVVGPLALAADSLVAGNAQVAGRSLVPSPAVALALGAHCSPTVVAGAISGGGDRLNGELTVLGHSCRCISLCRCWVACPS